MNSTSCTIRAIAVIVATFCLLCTTAVADQLMFMEKPVVDGTWDGEPTQYIAGEILVMFYDNDAPADDIVSTINGTIVRGIEDDGFAKIQVDIDADIPALCVQLYNNPLVRFAEPNFYATIGEWTPNDNYYPDSTWSHKNTGQDPPNGIPDADINTPWAWDYTRGSTSVILAIKSDVGKISKPVGLVDHQGSLNIPEVSTDEMVLTDRSIHRGYEITDLNTDQGV